MTTLLRRCLLLLLCLTLPLNGMASLLQPAEPCPMQAAGMQMDAESAHDCCEDLEQLSAAGKTCKTGQDCKTGSMLQALLGKPSLPLARLPGVTFYFDFLPNRTPADVWRPPRA